MTQVANAPVGRPPGRTVSTHPVDERRSTLTRSVAILVLGVPAAVVIAAIWSVMEGASSLDGEPRVSGGGAVLLNLPGYLLIVGTTIIALTEAGRVRHSGTDGPPPVATAWMFGVCAPAVTMMFLVWVTTTLDGLVDSPSPALLWAGRALALAAGVTATVLADRRAERRLIISLR